jgi:hypothetical protein
MMAQIDAFKPDYTGTVTIAVTGASQTVAIPGNGEFLEVQNAGATVVIFIVSTFMPNGAAAAVATSYPVLPGQSKLIRRNWQSNVPQDNAVSVIGGAAGPTTVYVTPGMGI